MVMGDDAESPRPFVESSASCSTDGKTTLLACLATTKGMISEVADPFSINESINDGASHC